MTVTVKASGDHHNYVGDFFPPAFPPYGPWHPNPMPQPVPAPYPVFVPSPLTEEDIRRIVREELDRESPRTLPKGS